MTSQAKCAIHFSTGSGTLRNQSQEKKSRERQRRPPGPPFPPFTRDSAMQRVRLDEDAWNTRDPAKVALAYAIDSPWRNRSEFINGRNEINAFFSRKWANELDYRLIKELWALLRLGP
jgi:nuclear transport factor 2 (NTF2) superfamily protein